MIFGNAGNLLCGRRDVKSADVGGMKMFVTPGALQSVTCVGSDRRKGGRTPICESLRNNDIMAIHRPSETNFFILI